MTNVKYTSIKYWISTPSGDAAVIGLRIGEMLVAYPEKMLTEHMKATICVLQSREWMESGHVRVTGPKLPCDRPPLRFYWGYSHIYGNTVYDRKFQSPAFEFGAETNMDEYHCRMLVNKLNSADRRGILDGLRNEED